MKDNNLNLSTNVENIDIYYKPEGPITKSVYELLKTSKEGDYNNLKHIVEEKAFTGSTLNLAFRNLINEKKFDKLCLKLLLSTNIDLNYKYAKEDNKTILMMVFRSFDSTLLEEFLENLQFKEENNYLSNEKKEENEINEKKIFFSQKDSNNNNFMHFFEENIDKIELLKMFDYIYDKYPFYKNPRPEVSKQIQQIFKNLFIERNNDGNTVMNICLFHGFPKFVFKLIKINGYIPNVNNQKNNYVHCAILGRNLASVKILLYYCSLEELNMKNCDMLTPAQLAYKMGYMALSNLIIEYQNNFNEEGYKEHFFSTLEVYEKKINNLPKDLLINFQNHNYRQLLYELKELLIINSLVDDNSNQTSNNIENEDEIIYKISSLKIEWNILLIQIKISQNNFQKDSDNNSKTSTDGKKLKKFEDKNKNMLCRFFKPILNIFEIIFSNKFILSYIDLLNKLKSKNKEFEVHYINIEKNIDILIYNKIIFYFKFGYTNSLIDTAHIYLTKIFKFNDDITTIKKEFILFVNISCILTETFISQGLHNFAEIIISALDKYLSIISQKIKLENIEFTKEEITIFTYLTRSGVFNLFSVYLNDSFCYSNYLKLLIFKDKIKEVFSHIKINLENAKFSKEITLVNRLYTLLPFMEIKKLYEKEDNQIYNRISKLNNLGEEGEIYYFNTLGIIYLKKQKYYISLFFFKKALHKYIQILKNTNIQNNHKERLLNFRIDYITSFLYNICLCNFYLKKYDKCVSILEQLLQFKNNQKNIFIYYRLALCYFHLNIIENKRHSDYYNENILKIIGYEKDKNKIKKNKNEKTLSIDLENEDGSDNLARQFEVECKNNNKKNIYKDTNDNNNLNMKKIILKNTTKLINIKNENNFTNKNNIYNINNSQTNIFNKETNINNNTKIIYIDKAIKYFKKVILMSKVNTYTNSMKSLYNFYFSYTEDTKNNDNLENFHKRKKVPYDLLINTYLNLLLCLSIKKNWPEMIFIIKDYNNKKIISNKIIALKILLYKLEAYTNLRNTQKINETINKLKGYKKIELSLFNKVNNNIINEVNIKFYLYYTLTIIYMKEKNFKEMDINVDKLLFLLKEEKNIPYYIIDLLINVYLIKLNNESNINEKNKYRYNNIILNLIKNKKTNLNK